MLGPGLVFLLKEIQCMKSLKDLVLHVNEVTKLKKKQWKSLQNLQIVECKI